jgi:lipoate-protein ligase A
MKKELGAKPRREMIKELYIEKCEEVLKEKVEESHFTDAELQAMESLDAKFSSEEWLRLKGNHVRPAVKIHSGIWVGDTTYKATGGLIRARIRIRDNYLDDISLSGDFTFYPQTRLSDFEKTLLQTEISEEKLLEKIRNFYRESGVQSPGVEAEDWVKAITLFAESIEKG